MSIQFIGLILFFAVFAYFYSSYFSNFPSATVCSQRMHDLYKKAYTGTMHRKSQRFGSLGMGVGEGLRWVFDFAITAVLIGVLPWGFPVLASWEVVAGLMPRLFYSVNILQLDTSIFSKSLKFKQSVLKSFFYFPLIFLRVVIRPVTLTVRMLANALVGAIICHSVGKKVIYGFIYGWGVDPRPFFYLSIVIIWELVVILVQRSLFLGLAKIYFSPTPVKFKVKV